MEQLPTFTLFDLSDEKQKEFIQIFRENCAILRHRYLYYDQLRHHKWLGWFYKRVANRYYKKWQDYEEIIKKIVKGEANFMTIQMYE